MINTHYKTIFIETDMGNWEVTFNPTVPHGYDALSKAIAKHIADNEFCKLMAKKNKREASIFWLQKQSEDAEGYIDAIKMALDEAEYNKIADTLRHIDITSLASISNAILDSYIGYYKQKMKEGLEA